MTTVTGPLALWTGETGSWHFITVPEKLADEIRAHALGSPRGFKSVKVEVRIGDIRWRTSIFPISSGGYFLPVKKEVRCGAGIGAGDQVTVELELL
jgi:hypothetical protein